MSEYNDLLISFLKLLFNPLWFVLVLLLLAQQRKFIKEVLQFWPSVKKISVIRTEKVSAR
jgi:hypothetical protein